MLAGRLCVWGGDIFKSNRFYQGDSSGGGEKGPDSGYILKIESIGLPDGLNMECEKKGNIRSFGLSNWKHKSCHQLTWGSSE